MESLIDDIIVDAYGEDEHMSSFEVAFEDNVVVPTDASVAGTAVTVCKIEYDGNVLRGLTALYKSAGGVSHTVALCDVVFPEGTKGARYGAAYRKWMGI